MRSQEEILPCEGGETLSRVSQRRQPRSVTLPSPPSSCPGTSFVRRCCVQAPAPKPLREMVGAPLGRFSKLQPGGVAIQELLELLVLIQECLPQQEEDSLQREKTKRGNAFTVVSVTDFNKVMQLCFIINHILSSPKRSSNIGQPLVIMGNKKDLQFDRMFILHSTEDSKNLSKALRLSFYEISTLESYKEAVVMFSTLY